MTFISKSKLPTEFHAAYDKAAKGFENDETRTNGKNDETKIDSEKEVLIFEQEVEQLYNNNKIETSAYVDVKICIDDTKKEVDKIKHNAKMAKDKNEKLKREVIWHNKRVRFERAIKKNTPFLYFIMDIIASQFAPCSAKPSDDKFRGFQDKADLIDNELKEKLNALW